LGGGRGGGMRFGGRASPALRRSSSRLNSGRIPSSKWRAEFCFSMARFCCDAPDSVGSARPPPQNSDGSPVRGRGARLRSGDRSSSSAS